MRIRNDAWQHPLSRPVTPHPNPTPPLEHNPAATSPVPGAGAMPWGTRNVALLDAFGKPSVFASGDCGGKTVVAA
jgi:hypothetical protein